MQGKYSFGIVDRVAVEYDFQLEAFFLAKQAGVVIIPVSNNSLETTNDPEKRIITLTLISYWARHIKSPQRRKHLLLKNLKRQQSYWTEYDREFI